MFTASFLFASLIWSSIGVGYFVYGKRQHSVSAAVGGMAMIAASYLAPTVLIMSLIGIGLMILIFFLAGEGY